MSRRKGWLQRALKNLEQRSRLGAGECPILSPISGMGGYGPILKSSLFLGRLGVVVLNNQKEKFFSIDGSTLPFLLSEHFTNKNLNITFIALLQL